MNRIRLQVGALVASVLLAAVPSVHAHEHEHVVVETATIAGGQAYNFDQPNRGFVRIIGTFTTSAPLDLGAADVHAMLHDVLLEADGEELVEGLPIMLVARTRSPRITVFETLDGPTLYRLVARTCIPTQEACPNSRGLDVGEYEFRIEVVNQMVHSPTGCGPAPGPGTTEFTTRFVIHDHVNPPIEVVIEDWPWTCLFQTGRVIAVRTP